MLYHLPSIDFSLLKVLQLDYIVGIPEKIVSYNRGERVGYLIYYFSFVDKMYW